MMIIFGPLKMRGNRMCIICIACLERRWCLCHEKKDAPGGGSDDQEVVVWVMKKIGNELIRDKKY